LLRRQFFGGELELRTRPRWLPWRRSRILPHRDPQAELMSFFAVLLFSFLAPQTASLSLTGVVTDSAARPVANVQVHLEEPTTRQQWGMQTKADGTFRFDRLSLGTYRVTIRGEGYFETSVEVRLESSKVVEFTLAAAETVKEEVDVIARPEPINVESVAPQNQVNDEVIQNLPYTGRQNFLNALALMPGVLQDNTNQIHIHGSRPDQIRYQLDGLNVTDPSSGELGAAIPIDAIESVDMDLANYSAEFGKASGGVVRVHSQFVGDKYRFNATDFIPGWDFRQKSIAEFSPRLLFSGPLIQKKLWFMYSGTIRYIHSFLEELQGPPDERTRTQSSSDQLLKLQWNLRDSHVFTLEMLHNAEYYGNSGLSLVRPRDATTNALRRGTTIGISDRHIVRRKVIEATFQWTRRRDSDLAKGIQPMEVHPNIWLGNYYSDRFGRNQRFHSVASMAWDEEGAGLKHHFKAGGEFDWVDSDIFLNRRPFTIIDDQGRLKSWVGFAGATRTDIRNQEYGAFIEDRLTVTRKLQLQLGVRFDRERVVGRNNFAPRAGFSFLPFGTARSKLSGGVGLFYDNIELLNLQLPQLQRRYTTIYDNSLPIAAAAATAVRVDPYLRNPKGTHWNLGWENEWAPRWVTRIDYLQKKGRDQTRFAALQNPTSFDLVVNNSGTSDYRAIEVSLDRPIRTNLRFLASYIYSQAKARPTISLDFPDPAVELIPEAPVDWDTPHRFVGWGYFPLPAGLSASFSIEARSGFPYTTIDDLNRVASAYNSRRMPAYFVTNASVEKQLPIPLGNGKRMAFRVGVTNLFNQFNPRFIDRNVNSPYYMALSDSSSRHFSARVRILKK
jgi:TonB dependent receptor-like, beta-barrel/Carboxypeptidase regulatory-like domain/TonB-dependent Receptor Plug Domain